MIKVRINKHLITMFLTEGYSTREKLTIIKGLPPGCVLLGVVEDPIDSDILTLGFIAPGVGGEAVDLEINVRLGEPLADA